MLTKRSWPHTFCEGPMWRYCPRGTYGTKRLAIDLDQPAYDCIYLALTLENGWRFITADERFRRKLTQRADGHLADSVLSMRKAVSLQRQFPQLS